VLVCVMVFGKMERLVGWSVGWLVEGIKCIEESINT
jgi:hypothetical protein